MSDRAGNRGAAARTHAAAIETLFQEAREFPPPPAFAAQANINDPAIYDEAAADPEAFWAAEAARLDWYRPWDTILEWDPPFAKWFVGGQLNVSVNCLDRHVNAGGGDKIAYYWEGEPGDRKTLTYADLYAEVHKAANALTALGVRRGDRVAAGDVLARIRLRSEDDALRARVAAAFTLGDEGPVARPLVQGRIDARS